MSDHYQELLNDFSVSLPTTLPRAVTEIAPVLEGRFGVSLETCETEVERFFAKWVRDDRLAPLWGEYGGIESAHVNPREQMNRMLGSGICLVIGKQSESEPLGFVCAKEAAPPRRHLSVGIFLEDAYRGAGYGAVAFAIFLRYLFHNFDAPKLVFNLYGWDCSGLRALAHLEQFKLEGVRSGHFRMDGQLHDLYEMALSRDDYQTLIRTALWKNLLGGCPSTTR